MISYLKIEIFAYNLFNTVWLKGGLISLKYDAIQIYQDQCLSDNDFELVCDKIFYDAVLCRRILFQRIYMEEIVKEKDKYWGSVSDFYEYVRSTCNRYDWFGCLTVFERIFATCAFVINLCFYNRENENVDIIKFGHICWATYFDAFTEEFYEEGGWNQLKSASDSYTSALLFLQMCLRDPENILLEVTEAVEKYYNPLKKISIIEECQTISKLWVKSRIKNLHLSSNNLVAFGDYENCFHAEYILNELKSLCCPCALEVLQYDEECSGRSVFDSDSFYIPLTPTRSQESIPERNSLSTSFDGADVIPERSGEDVLFTSSSDCGEICSEFKTVDNDFVNKSSYELEDIISRNSSNDSCGCLHIFEQPIEFESIRIISDWEQDQCLSRSMAKMQLNHETLELEEITNSETGLCSNTNNSYSVGNDLDVNTKDLILVPQEVTNKQCLILEDSSNAVELCSTDAFINVFVTEGNPSHNKGFKEDEFVNGTMFFNTATSYDNKISVSDWDEKDLVKNISTPIKQKKS